MAMGDGRDRDEIIADIKMSGGDPESCNQLLILEVLLDIRDRQKQVRDYLKQIEINTRL